MPACCAPMPLVHVACPRQAKAASPRRPGTDVAACGAASRAHQRVPAVCRGLPSPPGLGHLGARPRLPRPHVHCRCRKGLSAPSSPTAKRLTALGQALTTNSAPNLGRQASLPWRGQPAAHSLARGSLYARASLFLPCHDESTPPRLASGASGSRCLLCLGSTRAYFCLEQSWTTEPRE